VAIGAALIVIGLLAIGGLALWLVWPAIRRNDEA
jgi:hypothetical protein